MRPAPPRDRLLLRATGAGLETGHDIELAFNHGRVVREAVRVATRPRR